MRTRFPLVIPASIVLTLFATTHAGGEILCRPALSITEVRFSEVRGQQRSWTAVVAVDASSCATSSGRFYINFLRIKEMAPDVLFTEEFTWRPGQIEVSLDFWADEAVHDHWISYVGACACRR
jgi:hypothetical protein